MKKIIVFILVACLMLSIAMLFSACGDDGPEYRTYPKVYKDSNGNWQGRDVTYDAHVEGSPLLTLVIIVVVLFFVAKLFKK